MKKEKIHLIIIQSIVIFLVVSSYILIEASSVKAQPISLGITPPLNEVMIMPGKEVTQTYTLTNNGSETIVSVDIVPFLPGDSYGNPDLQEFLPGYPLEKVKSWIIIEDPKINWGGKFLLPRGGSKDITIKIAPPEGAPEGDYYLTMLFKTSTQGLVGKDALGARAEIGTNILMTVSNDGNPEKSAQVEEFNAPMIVDSLGTLSYFIKIANTGSAFFKPVGEITVKPLFASPTSIDVAPLNILSSSERVIPCIEDGSLFECKIPKKVLLGIYQADLTFQTDGEGKTYEATTTTIAFPFIITLGILISYLVIKLIQSYQSKGAK